MSGNRITFRPLAGTFGSCPDACILPDKVRAGIKAAASLARCGRRKSMTEIESDTEIASALLGTVLAALHRDGLVYRDGAVYGLALPREAITIAQIARALTEEGEEISGSLIPAAPRSSGDPCRVEQFAHRLNAGITALLDNYSLAEAVADERAGEGDRRHGA